MTPANALAGTWTAVWRLSAEKFDAAIASGSWTAACGSTTLTGGTLKIEADKHLKYTLPSLPGTTAVSGKNKVKGVPTGSTLERFTYKPICAAKSKL